jgi:hypothetical protein
MGFLLFLGILFIGVPCGMIIFAVVLGVGLHSLYQERRSPRRDIALIQKSIVTRWILLAGTTLLFPLFILYLHHLATRPILFFNPGCVPC